MAAARSYLFVTWEGGGNVPPVLGIARRLQERGHRVTVLTEPCLREAVESWGGRFVPFERHFTREDRAVDLIGDWEVRTPPAALQRTLSRVVLGPIEVVATETRAAIGAVRPDVVVADLMMPGALIAAEAAGVPRVVLFHMPEYLPGPGRPAAGPGFLPRTDLFGRIRDRLMTHLMLRLFARYLPEVEAAQAKQGLPPVGSARGILELYHRADLRLIQTCEAFDFPIKPAPANVRYVGPVLDDPDWTHAAADPEVPDDSRPLVVVGLSSTFQNQRDTLQRIISALGTLDVRGLVTLGPAMAGERFATPPNVMTVASASHAGLFPRAAAVVTHGGHGTVMRALASGVPLLCMPMGRDQDDTAARVVARGVGLRLSRSAGSSRIAAAVRRLLSEPDFAVKAAGMAATIGRDAEDDRAVLELERVGTPGT